MAQFPYTVYARILQGHPEVDNLRRSYYAWLTETKQNEKAGEMKESEGDYVGAVNFYLKAGLPAKAAWLAMNRDELLSSSIVGRITSALIKEEFYERVSHTVTLYSTILLYAFETVSDPNSHQSG